MVTATVQKEDKTTKQVRLKRKLEEKSAFPKIKDKMFRKIGAIGWEQLSTPLIVSLATGFPIAIMGEAGTGKTFISKQIGSFMLACNQAAIDASKASWEELVGPWSPKELMENNKMVFMHTELSLWDKELLFVDEITRGETRVLNGFLELLKDNTIHGLPTAIKWKIAAANYLHHEGTTPLSEAQADRFAFVVDAPRLIDQSEDNLYAILEQGDKVDEILIRNIIPGFESKADKYENISAEFQAYLIGVGKVWQRISKQLKLAKYCVKLSTTYQGSLTSQTGKGKSLNPFEIEQRRFKQLYNILQWYIAIEVYEYENYLASLTPEQKAEFEFTKEEYDGYLQEKVFECVTRNVNVKLSGKDFDATILQEAHQIALKEIDSGDLQTTIYRITKEPDATKKLYLSLFNIDEEPMCIQEAFDLLHQGYDLNEQNHFGTKWDETSKELLAFDVILPLIPIMMPGSPFSEFYAKVPEDLKTKMREVVEFAYQYKLLENKDDYQQEISDFLLKEKFDEEKEKSGELSLEDTYGEGWKNLSPLDKMLRETLFRRFVADEGKFARIALGLGEQEKTEDEKKKKKEQKAIDDSYQNLVLPSYRWNVKQAVSVIDKIAAVVKDCELEHLIK